MLQPDVHKQTPRAASPSADDLLLTSHLDLSGLIYINGFSSVQHRLCKPRENLSQTHCHITDRKRAADSREEVIRNVFAAMSDLERLRLPPLITLSRRQAITNSPTARQPQNVSWGESYCQKNTFPLMRRSSVQPPYFNAANTE